jgi:eukaryotic-like serine/threonine-protein kinase
MALPALVPPDDLLGNYRIVSKLASGGMGVVYKAYDVRLQRTVALKFLNGDGGLKAEDRERVLREARAASALDHENIASVHAVEEGHDGQLFIVMGYYEGENLAARMSRAPLTLEQSIDITQQIARGLSHAHSHNIIHRDIKPSNVILCSDGTAKIVDFGLARMESEDATQSIGVSGTLPYMSPEQVTGKQVDHRTDIWSLGVMMYELVVRRHPFQAQSPAATVAAVSKALPPPMREVPIPLQMIIYRMLSKDPADRYQSCLELIHDLDACRQDSDLTLTAGVHHLKSRIRKAGETDRKRLGTLAKFSIAALIALAAVVAVLSVVRVPSLKSMGTTPAAYESYEKGTSLLDHFYRPEAINLAMVELNKSVSADPKYALAYVAMAKAYFYQYRLTQSPELLEQAELYCKKALDSNDKLSSVHVILGRILISQGKTALAQSELDKAKELDPKSAEASLALGDLYGVLGRPADAEEAYEQGIELNPDSWDGYYRSGNFLITQHRYGEALAKYKEVLAIVPDHAYARTNLAVALKELHRPQEAEAELKKALEFNKVYSAYGNLANIYYEQRRYAEAAEAGSQALALNQSNFMVWNNQGIYYEWLGRSDKAEAAYNRALTLLEQQVKVNPNDAAVHAYLALRLLKQRHDTTKAVSHIRTALALQPKNSSEPKDGRVLQIAGVIQYALGDKVKALNYVLESMRYGRDVKDFDLDPDMRGMMGDPKVHAKLETAQAGTSKVGKL